MAAVEPFENALLAENGSFLRLFWHRNDLKIAHFQPEVHFQKALQPPIFVENWSYIAQTMRQEYSFSISFMKSFYIFYIHLSISF